MSLVGEDDILPLRPNLPHRDGSRACYQWKVGKHCFHADFDSGNLSSVVQGPQISEFLLWTNKDCQGTIFEKGTRTWFYYSVSGHEVGESLVMTIMNLNKQSRLYSQDYRPWYWSCSMLEWQPIRTKVASNFDGENFEIRFGHRFESSEETYFAFAIPFTYTDVQTQLSWIDSYFSANTLADPNPPSTSTEENGVNIASQIGVTSDNCKEKVIKSHVKGIPKKMSSQTKKNEIYYRRQLLARSLDGRRVDLITISDTSGAVEGLEPPLGEGILQDPEDFSGPCPIFAGKKVFFVSARVHPGETPSSHMLNGLLAFLLRQHDPRAVAARARWVFKLVPLVNPDGVYRGNYRTDSMGQNLNRCYTDPDPATQPTIHAIKTYLSFLASRNLLEFYIDLHAHANKQGVFAYGNPIADPIRQIDVLTYTRLVALNSQIFDFSQCDFSKSNVSRPDKEGGNKDGAGRVALHRETGLPHMYTVEANYNTVAAIGALPPASGNHGGFVTPTISRGTSPRFTAKVLQSVGRALVYGALDLYGLNPWTRVRQSEFKTLDGVRAYVAGMAKAYTRDRGSSSAMSAAVSGFKKLSLAPSAKASSQAAAASGDRSTLESGGRATGSSRTNLKHAASQPLLTLAGGAQRASEQLARNQSALPSSKSTTAVRSAFGRTFSTRPQPAPLSPSVHKRSATSVPGTRKLDPTLASAHSRADKMINDSRGRITSTRLSSAAFKPRLSAASTSVSSGIRRSSVSLSLPADLNAQASRAMHVSNLAAAESRQQLQCPTSDSESAGEEASEGPSISPGIMNRPRANHRTLDDSPAVR